MDQKDLPDLSGPFYLGLSIEVYKIPQAQKVQDRHGLGLREGKRIP